MHGTNKPPYYGGFHDRTHLKIYTDFYIPIFGFRFLLRFPGSPREACLAQKRSRISGPAEKYFLLLFLEKPTALGTRLESVFIPPFLVYLYSVSPIVEKWKQPRPKGVSSPLFKKRKEAQGTRLK